MSETATERDARLGAGGFCPECNAGRLTVRKNGMTGELFLGCTWYPDCDYTEELEEEPETEGVWGRRYEGQ